MIVKPVDRAFAALPTLSLRDTALLWTFTNALTFDFKPKETGGNALQLVFVVIAMIAGLILILEDKPFPLPNKVGWGVAFLSLFVALNFANIFIANFTQPTGFDFMYSIRSSVPLILAPLGMGVVASLARKGLPMAALARPIAISALISCVFRFVYGRALLNFQSSEETRWEVLSPIMYILVGYGLAGLMYARKFDLVGVLAFLAFIVVNLASATRSLTIGLAYALLLLPILLFMSGRVFEKAFMQRLAVGAVGIVAVALLGLAVVQMYRPDGVMGLLNRGQNADYYAPNGDRRDLTLMLRESQFEGMKQGLASSPYAALFGKGTGVPYLPDRYYEGSVPFRLFVTDPAGFSDLGLAYLIYVDGYLVGGAFVLFLAVMPFMGFWASARLSKQGYDQESLMAARASLALAAFFALNFSWAGTYERPAMLMFGVLGGIVLVSMDRVKYGRRVNDDLPARDLILRPEELGAH